MSVSRFESLIGPAIYVVWRAAGAREPLVHKLSTHLVSPFALHFSVDRAPYLRISLVHKLSTHGALASYEISRLSAPFALPPSSAVLDVSGDRGPWAPVISNT